MLITKDVKSDVPAEVKIEEVKIEDYAKEKVAEKFGEKHWPAFHKLIQKESSWDHEAKNPKSSATGLGQFLDSTWKSVGCEKTLEPKIQIDCAIKYIEKIYETPEKALVFHNKNNYY